MENFLSMGLCFCVRKGGNGYGFYLFLVIYSFDKKTKTNAIMKLKGHQLSVRNEIIGECLK